MKLTTVIAIIVFPLVLFGYFLTTFDWGNKNIVCGKDQIKSKLGFNGTNPSYSCQEKEEYNNKIRYNCKENAKDMVDGTMSDTWGNDEYNTAPPTTLMEKVYFECLEKGLK